MKKILSLIVAILLFFSVNSFPVTIASGTETPAFVVSSVVSVPGDMANVEIFIRNNPGVASVKVTVYYDVSLVLNSISYGNDLGGVSQLPNALSSPVILNWVTLSPSENDVVFATLSFTVKPNAQLGEKAVTLTYEPDDVFDIDEGNIYFDVENGAVNIVNCLHKNTEVRNAKAATCTEKGYTGDTYCLSCGKKIADGEEIPELNHKWGEWTVTSDPTCTEKGVETRVCVNDPSHIETRDIDCLGHDYNVVVTPATCTEGGYTTHTCSRCGDSYVNTYTDALGHTGGTATCHSKAVCERCGKEYGEFNPENHDGETEVRNAKSATCTEKGYTGDTYCLSCGEKIADGEEIPELNHKWGEWTVTSDPTCTEKGVETRVCVNDPSHIETRDIDCLGHDYNVVVTPATCTEGGYTTHTCSRCGDSYVDTYTDALGHTVGDWQSDADGHWHSCSVCEEKLDEAAHTASDWIVDTPATAESKGHQHKECTVCGYVIAEEDIPVLTTHTPGDINGDGKVNNKDLTRLFQYLSDWDVEVNEPALDVNGDGKVNNKDLTRLFQYLSDWDVEIS